MPVSKREDLIINTIIGPGTTVSGDIHAAGFVRADGSLNGNLDAQGRIVIGEDSRIQGDISGTFISVGGVVKGNILAEEGIHIRSSALVIGDVITRHLRADEGSLIHGRIVSCGDTENWENKLAEYRDSVSVRSTIRAYPDTAEGSNG